MLDALNGLLDRVDSIERTIDIRDQLVIFGQVSPEGLPAVGAELLRTIREVGQIGMQPTLDGAVLLLAAALEQFVSNLVNAFTAILPDIVPKYGDLPERIRSANENMTGEALSVRGYRSRFSDYDVRQFIDNLSICRTEIGRYTLNGEALVVSQP